VKTIVVGYDDSEDARRALGRAAELAEVFGAKLVVTSVAEPLPDLAQPIGPTPDLSPATTPLDTSDLHREELESARELLKERDVEADFVLGRGSAADAIVQLADERAADLIVVGSREPGFLDRLLGGSVSEGVSRRAHCDVLIVH
jgi:nucleotide-binding universal stress UspA family protein